LVHRYGILIVANLVRLQNYGNQILCHFDDGSNRVAYPTVGGLWIVGHPDGGGGGPITPGPPANPGSDSPTGGPPLGSTVIYPTTTHDVSDTFLIHQQRNSPNPGTDYTAPFGSKVYSVADGVVTDAQPNYAGGGGMTIHIDNNDGSGADYLHLHHQEVAGGYTVSQGQLIGESGGSGFGNEHYYGAHLHISYRHNHSHGYYDNGNVDFDAIVRAEPNTLE
jgi:murein DD-endopeptidase MepM/ murein hydrolase activator NlpD